MDDYIAMEKSEIPISFLDPLLSSRDPLEHINSVFRRKAQDGDMQKVIFHPIYMQNYNRIITYYR